MSGLVRMAPVMQFRSGWASNLFTMLVRAAGSSTPSLSRLMMYLPSLLYSARFMARDLPCSASSHCIFSSGKCSWHWAYTSKLLSWLRLFTRKTRIRSAG